jgi:hypothetical protein
VSGERGEEKSIYTADHPETSTSDNYQHSPGADPTNQDKPDIAITKKDTTESDMTRQKTREEKTEEKKHLLTKEKPPKLISEAYRTTPNLQNILAPEDNTKAKTKQTTFFQYHQSPKTPRPPPNHQHPELHVGNGLRSLGCG